MKGIAKDVLKGLLFVSLMLLLAAGCNMGMLEPDTADERTSTSESMYYPLHHLSTNEFWQASYLSPGTVIVVRPGFQWGLAARYSTAENMVRSNQVRTIVMSGVGSSSRGTAAMAKLVANAIGEPVAGIVSGIGDWGTAFYGSQGYFVGRPNNDAGTWYHNAASLKMYQLMRDGARPFRIIGHSKGSMDTANALFRLNSEGRRSTYSQATFISFGVGVKTPPGLARKRQYMGTSDHLGSTNTTSTDNMNYVSGRGHSLNPAMSMHVPVSGRLHR